MAITVITLGGCRRMMCVEGNGYKKTETRFPGSFSKVVSEGSFEVSIIKDDDDFVEVEAESNLIGLIRTTVNDNSLIIDNRHTRCFDANVPIRIIVHMSNLDGIKLTGSGRIESEYFISPYMRIRLEGSGNIFVDADVDEIDVEITGSGDIGLYGKANISNYEISGSGNINGFDMKSVECYSDIGGSGEIFCASSNLLDVNITGSGTCYFIGNPIIHSKITGSGEVVRSDK